MPKIAVTFWDHEWIAKNGSGKSPEIVLRLSDPDFMPLLKLVWRADWNRDMTEPLRNMLLELGIQFSRKKFHVQDGDEL